MGKPPIKARGAVIAQARPSGREMIKIDRERRQCGTYKICTINIFQGTYAVFVPRLQRSPSMHTIPRAHARGYSMTALRAFIGG
jgi:hypothetical protein